MHSRTRFIYHALAAAAATACVAAQAQTTPAEAAAPAVVQTLESVTVRAQSDEPNWQKLRQDESRVRPMGSEPETVTLETTAAQHTSVVTHDELNMINAMNTLDVMERVPGVTVTRTGALDGVIVLRGMSSSGFRVPMFINGDRFRGRPSFQFMMISPAELERVEVIRGPASIRYGSDGLSGLVNFVTRKPKGTLGERFALQGGDAALNWRSNGSGLQGDASLEAAGANKDFRAYVTARHADAYDAPGGEILNSHYRTVGVGFATGYMPNARERYELSYRYGSIRDGTSNGSTTENNTSRRVPLTIHQARLGYEGTFDGGPFSRIDASVYANAFESMLETLTLSNNGNNLRRTVNNVRGPNIVGGHITLETSQTPYGLRWSLGADFAHDHWLGTKQRVESANHATGAYTDTGFERNGRELTQSNIGLFALADWQVQKGWNLTAGGRFDFYNTDTEVAFLGSEDLRPLFEAARNSKTRAWTGSIGTSYFVSDTVELTASYGSGFHMPWHSQMFSSGWNGESYTLPNPQLKPEYSSTAEAGARLHLPRAFVDIALYDSRYRNFMSTAQTTYLGLPATQTQNIGKARIYGMDLSAKWQVTERVNLHGNLAYTHGTDRSANKPIAGLAPWSGKLGAQYVGGNNAWSVTSEVQFAQGKKRWNSATEYRTGGYGVVNVFAQLQLDRLGWTLTQNAQAVIGVTNLFDKEYRSASTGSVMSQPMSNLNPLVSPGRSFNVTLRSTF
ncbi:MAG: TonB-dependent receptor [Burkholderiaceae bacterium]|jgi:hemoglobin/transferrin/lactoferrin receptor protein|nr:TonB-dependent receptor [Burkholderiaceae bacterium]